MRTAWRENPLRPLVIALLLIESGVARGNAPQPVSPPAAAASPQAVPEPPKPQTANALTLAYCESIQREMVELAKALRDNGNDVQPDCRQFQIDQIIACTQLFVERNGTASALNYLDAIHTANPCDRLTCTLAVHRSDYLSSIKPRTDRAAEDRTISDGEVCLGRPGIPDDYRKKVASMLPRQDIKERALRWKWSGISLLGVVTPLLLGASIPMAVLDQQPTGSMDCSFAGIQRPCVYELRAPMIIGFSLAGASAILGGISLYKWKQNWKEYRGETAGEK